MQPFWSFVRRLQRQLDSIGNLIESFAEERSAREALDHIIDAELR
jgi:hypothetical protein